MNRVLVIGLDGYEQSLGDRFMASGDMPALKRLRESSARFLLDHGSAKRTGLAWEHFSSGLSPESARRWSAVSFDPLTYEVEQKGTVLVPFTAGADMKTVVLDPPYFDLSRAGSVQGITAWGAHDAGTETASEPAGLLAEAISRFGPYPATQWIYGYAWPDPQRCTEMGEALVRAVRQRSAMTRWLMGERLPEWDLGIVVVSELHSAVEALWHGVDESHPLHGHPSAAAAGNGLVDVYRAVDAMIGELAASFPDADLLLFNMHGMGPNHSDVASMLLLPELLYRLRFGEPFFCAPAEWASAPAGVPVAVEAHRWHIDTPDTRNALERLGDFASRKLPEPVREMLGVRAPGLRRRQSAPMEWMPASRYQPFWPDMDAFALPSYYDGSVRLNVMGRESRGRVPVEAYENKCREIVSILEECRDPHTGKAVIDHVVRYRANGPLDLHPTQGDLIVVWNGSPLALEHPRVGRIGPAPFRRTGGHTGKFGIAYVKSGVLEAGDHGTRSAYDVVPTLLELLNQPVPHGTSGTSLFAPPSEATPRPASRALGRE